MASFAYVLIKCEPGYEDLIVDELKSLSEVVCAHTILGSPFDIIVKVEADSESKARNTINRRIRSIDKIKATNTTTT
jgi:DNA-binding Lrp family transcriptional regulator